MKPFVQTYLVTSALCASTMLGATARAAELHITVEGLTSADGKVMTALYDSAKAFPRGKPVQAAMAQAQAGSVKQVFADLAPGKYAIAVYHDVNGNQRLDANMVGIPSEPYGFSRDARGKMGPPSFDDAAFDVGSATVHQTMHVK